MPFSSLLDPVDVARADAALDLAWRQLRNSGEQLQQEDVLAKQRLALLVESIAHLVQDEQDLAERALARFKHVHARH